MKGQRQRTDGTSEKPRIEELHVGPPSVDPGCGLPPAVFALDNFHPRNERWTSFLFQSQSPDISCVQICYSTAICAQTTYNGSGGSGSCCSGGFYTQTHLNLPIVSGIGTLFFLFYRRGQVTCPKPHSHQRQRQDEPLAVCSEPAGILLLMCAGYCKIVYVLL